MDQLSDLNYSGYKSAKQILVEFVAFQQRVWPLARANYEGLKRVEEKVFQFEGFQIKAQFNPERIRSSAAKVDQQSIAERKCFLCAENRPVEQQSLAFGDDFWILVNPYPIFKTHLTIVSKAHTDQRFLPHLQPMLLLAQALEGFTVFYNGPRAGASAPDHMHFQAGEQGFMLVDDEYEALKKQAGKTLIWGQNTRVWRFNNYLRKMISVETVSLEEGLTVLEAYYQSFVQLQPAHHEPMMNVLCSWSKGRWILHLFPRKAHRPWQYFEEGERQLLISPGAVDMGGVLIIPRREDFDKISKEDIADMMKQVTLEEDPFRELIKRMKEILRSKHLGIQVT